MPAVKKKAPAKKAPVKAKAAPAKRKAAPKLKLVRMAKGPLKIGTKAPNFNLPATGTSGAASLSAMKGKAFVLYFYPKDDTSGCTVEACDFRDITPQFNRLGVTVIGVSRDNLASHEKFKKKYNLNFALASDEDGKVCEAYGVWVEKSMYGRKYMGIERSTFLIDEKGMLRAIWNKVSVVGHVAEVAKAIKNL